MNFHFGSCWCCGIVFNLLILFYMLSSKICEDKSLFNGRAKQRRNLGEVASERAKRVHSCESDRFPFTFFSVLRRMGYYCPSVRQKRNVCIGRLARCVIARCQSLATSESICLHSVFFQLLILVHVKTRHNRRHILPRTTAFLDYFYHHLVFSLRLVQTDMILCRLG